MIRRQIAPPIKPVTAFGENVNMGEIPNVDPSQKRAAEPINRNKKLKPLFQHPMTVDVIITLCTHELHHELLDWMPSARVAYPDAKLIIATDEDSKKILRIAKTFGIENFEVQAFDRAAAIPKAANIPLYNAKHWKPETIWGKLNETRRAVQRNEGKGVLFADSDITFVHPMKRKYRADLVLSPAFCGDLQRQTRLLTDRTKRIPLFRRDGLFNAGMWLTRSSEFMEWWLKALEMSGGDSFLEQTSLEHAPRNFVTDYMDTRENFGKWRFQAPPMDVNSLHFHTNERSMSLECTEIKVAAQAAGARARHQLLELKS